MPIQINWNVNLRCRTYQNMYRSHTHFPNFADVTWNHRKIENFQTKNSNIFHISAQNIDCGYTLEPPHRGGSNDYPQSMFLSRNKKNNVYPCKPQFYYIKWGLRGSKLYRRVFVMNVTLAWTYFSEPENIDLRVVVFFVVFFFFFFFLSCGWDAGLRPACAFTQNISEHVPSTYTFSELCGRDLKSCTELENLETLFP